MSPKPLIRPLAATALTALAAMLAPAHAGANATGCQAAVDKGTGLARFGACASSHGNLFSFMLAGGQQMKTEGYSICSDLGVDGYDAGLTEAGLSESTLVQPTIGKFPMTVTRTTNDGAFKLVQSYKLDTTNGAVTITNKVTNISSARRSLFFLRYADVDAGGTPNDDVGNATNDTVSISQPAGFGGVQLTLVGTTLSLRHFAFIETQAQWAQITPSQCSIGGTQIPTPSPGNYAMGFRVDADLAKGATKTIVMRYTRF